MPRKAAPKADAANADGELAPRRSSRIKEQPKAEAPKKATKPRGKKGAVTKAGADGEGAAKPPAARGRKRKADEKEGEEGADAAVETNGDAEAPTDEPAAKKTKAGSKPPSKVASKPASKAASVKPSSKASNKPASKKPASRAGSKKPTSKVGGEDKENAHTVAPGETSIAEDPEGEAAAEAADAAAAAA